MSPSYGERMSLLLFLPLSTSAFLGPFSVSSFFLPLHHRQQRRRHASQFAVSTVTSPADGVLTTSVDEAYYSSVGLPTTTVNSNVDEGASSNTVKDVNNRGEQRVTLTRYLSGIVQDRPELRDMESLLLSVQMGCKTISHLVNRAGINQLSSPQAMTNFIASSPSDDLRLNSMQRLDQLSTNVLRNALRFTGKLQTVKPATGVSNEGDDSVCPSRSHQPGVLIASAMDSRYVACFDPLDGSGNADAAICTGTVFGVFEADSEKNTADKSVGIDTLEVGGEDDDGPTTSIQVPAPHIDDDDAHLINAVLQPGKNLRAAGYCLYSSATILVFTLGDGTHGFTLDPQINEFVLTHPNITIPSRGNVYSCNEANSEFWNDNLKDYMRALKTGENDIQQRYALRYVGSMVGDIHRTLMYGGIFFYPADEGGLHPKGNLQLLYKSAPMSYIVEQAGGRSLDGNGGELLEVKPERVHERSPCFIGSPENIDEVRRYIVRGH